MRIMEVVTRSDLGGAQSVVINLSNSLCKYHEVIVVEELKEVVKWGSYSMIM